MPCYNLRGNRFLLWSFILFHSTWYRTFQQRRSSFLCRYLDERRHDGGKRDTYRQFIDNTKPYGSIITPLRCKSFEAAASLHDTVDFLFVDGDHSYAGVVADIMAWLPKLSHEAVVAFHDYAWAEGVQRAVEELVWPVERSPGRLIDNTYWAIVRR